MSIETPATTTPVSLDAECLDFKGTVHRDISMRASCIMPTHNRRSFVPRAIDIFLAQDLDDIELLILDDGTDSAFNCVPKHGRIRYFRTPATTTLGAKRNWLCQQARSPVIVHWDDDDWYPPWRVGAQLAVLETGEADVCGSRALYFLAPAIGGAWRYEHPGFCLAGSTLAYRRSFWEKAPFADVQTGEDVRFVRAVAPERLVDFADPALCVATIHPRNVSPKRPGGAGWSPVDPSVLRAVMDAAPRPTVCRPSRLKASCMMLTCDRRSFFALALELFAEQTYEHRELVVVDNGREPVEDLCSGVPGVRYVRAPQGLTIGSLRNIALEHATGEVVVHWDDDDWYGAERLRRQIAPIAQGRADVTGLIAREVLDLNTMKVWRLKPELHSRMFAENVHGGTLAYRKALVGERGAYPDSNLAEDAALLRRLLHAGARIERVDGRELFVYVRHGKNAWRFTSGEYLDRSGWTPAERPLAMTQPAMDRYQAAFDESRSTPLAPLGAPLLDCLGAVEVERPRVPLSFDRCVALVASDEYAHLLDAALASLDARGELPDFARLVFAVGLTPQCERVANARGATVVRCRPRRAAPPSLKGVLYSIAHVVNARQYLLLDCDTLVLDSLRPLIDGYGALPPGRMLAAREAWPNPLPTLGEALVSIYRASPADVLRLTAGDFTLVSHPRVLNDGVLIADRAALVEIDQALRAKPVVTDWVHARADVWWRSKAALNLVLAARRIDTDLDPMYNVQLHIDAVTPICNRGRVEATCKGGAVKILHFNGRGRRHHSEWVRRILD